MKGCKANFVRARGTFHRGLHARTRNMMLTARPSHLYEEAPLAYLKSRELNDMVDAIGESICRVSRY